MRRTILVVAFALGSSTGAFGGSGLAPPHPRPASVPSVEPHFTPKVERLALELGVTLDTGAAVDPRVGVRQLLRPLREAVSRIDFASGDSMMQLTLHRFVATLHDYAAGGGWARDPSGAAAVDVSTIDRVATALDGVVSILVESARRRSLPTGSGGSPVTKAGTGSISGTVTRDGTTTPIEAAVVKVYDSSGVYVAQGTTDAAGAYTVSGLGTGRYFAVTENSPGFFVDEAYLDRVCLNPWTCGVTSGTPIPVTDGAVTSGIDFALSVGGTITGQVREADTFIGLSSGITVAAYDAHGDVAGTAVPGSGDFTYFVRGLPEADYFVGASDATRAHVDEFHDDLPTAGALLDVFNSTAVHVLEDTFPTFVNFVLALGGSVVGTVTEEGTATPIVSGFVEVYDADGKRVRFAHSDGTGAYTVAGLPSGTYYAGCSDPSQQAHVREFWDDATIPCPPCDVTVGTPIVVTQHSATTGVDFALAKGGRVLGTVTAEGTGAPLEWATVLVYDDFDRQADWAVSASDGTYVTHGAVPTGSYYAAALGPTAEYVREVYPDTPCPGCSPTSGTAVAVTAGTDTTGIDFSLVTGGQVTGAVTIEGWGDPLGDGTVYIYDASGSLATSCYVSGGAYETSSGLPTGTYYATAIGPTAGVGLQRELFDDVPCPQELCNPVTGTQIGVTAPNPTTNIDFDLSPGARIEGFVADAVSGVPLLGMTVRVYDGGGALVATATSGVYGGFATDGFAPGTYFALAEDTIGTGYASQLYDGIPCDGCDVTAGTPIVISSAAPSEGVDFGLTSTGMCGGLTHLDLTSTTPVDSVETYEGCETITAGGTFGVLAPGDVRLRAGARITVTNGFFVEAGAKVTCEIDPALLP